MSAIKPLMSFIDTIHMGLYLYSYKMTEDEFDRLEQHKQQAREGISKDSESLIEFKGKYFQITGAKKIYAYVLVNEDLTVKIAKEISGGVYPEVFIEFRSRLLLAGARDAYNAVMEWVGKWADVRSEKVSRADLTTDFEGVIKVNLGDVVMRCRKSEEHGDHLEVHRSGTRVTGYSFGAGDMRLRIYDKTREIEEKRKQYVKAEWAKKGWDEARPVWRVEGQLRRRILKEFQIETFQNLIDHARDIWRYLTEQWFTLRVPQRGDLTRSRWPVSETWEVVQQSWKAFGELTGVVRERIKNVKIENIVPQVAGLVTTLMALLQKEGLEPGELVKRVSRHYRKKGKTVEDVIREKVGRYALFEETVG